MRGIVQVLCGVLVVTTVVGCLNPASIPPRPAPAKTECLLGKPEKSVPATTAGEPDMNLVEAGRQQLKNHKYIPIPVYSRAGTLGIIRLVEGNIGKLDDAILVFDDKTVNDSRLKLEDGCVSSTWTRSDRCKWVTSN
jgi:hypothetical protein